MSAIRDLIDAIRRDLRVTRVHFELGLTEAERDWFSRVRRAGDSS